MLQNSIKVKKIFILIAFLNFIFFIIEYILAFKISSVSLFANSIGFLENSIINILLFTKWHYFLLMKVYSEYL